MNWSAIGAVGELIGGAAVIVSLVYLAIQIRQNTRALQTSAYHQAVEQGWHANLAIAGNRELVELALKAAQGLDQLDPQELLRFTYVAQNHLFAMENLLNLHEQGLVPGDTWENALANSLPLLTRPGVLAFMESRPGPLSVRLLEHVRQRGGV